MYDELDRRRQPALFGAKRVKRGRLHEARAARPVVGAILPDFFPAT